MTHNPFAIHEDGIWSSIRKRYSAMRQRRETGDSNFLIMSGIFPGKNKQAVCTGDGKYPTPFVKTLTAFDLS